MPKQQGLTYWLEWLQGLKNWIESRPKGINAEPYYGVENVHYQDLADISDHFGVKHYPEDYKHRQWVQIEIDEEVDITFYSPQRAFYYHDIKG